MGNEGVGPCLSVARLRYFKMKEEKTKACVLYCRKSVLYFLLPFISHLKTIFSIKVLYLCKQYMQGALDQGEPPFDCTSNPGDLPHYML